MEPAPLETTRTALHWEDAGGRPRSFALKAGETVVGRSTTCDVVILHMSVSREHAKILASAGIYLLVDLGTAFGTYVNGRPIQVCVLRTGDRIEFGETMT